MSNQVKAFGSVERAVEALFLAHLAGVDDGHVGGDLAFDKRRQTFYIRIEKVGGSSDRFEGSFIVDIETFAVKYLDAESRSMDVEALLLGYPHVVEVDGRTWVFDEVSQNTGPSELPWEDDEVSRLGATYVLTARRR